MSATPLERAWRDERAKLVGSLARRFRDLALAEDAVQEAFAAAAVDWVERGGARPTRRVARHHRLSKGDRHAPKDPTDR